MEMSIINVPVPFSCPNTMKAGSGLDWFWCTYAKDSTNRKATDVLD